MVRRPAASIRRTRPESFSGYRRRLSAPPGTPRRRMHFLRRKGRRQRRLHSGRVAAGTGQEGDRRSLETLRDSFHHPVLSELFGDQSAAGTVRIGAPGSARRRVRLGSERARHFREHAPRLAPRAGPQLSGGAGGEMSDLAGTRRADHGPAGIAVAAPRTWTGRRGASSGPAEQNAPARLRAPDRGHPRGTGRPTGALGSVACGKGSARAQIPSAVRAARDAA